MFSPTYPGEFDSSESVYTLNYPVSRPRSTIFSPFLFTHFPTRVFHSHSPSLLDTKNYTQLPQVRIICLSINIQCVCDNQRFFNFTELPLEFPDGTTPIANHIYVYNGSQSWQHAILPPIQKLVGEVNTATQGRYGKKGRREVDRVIAEVNV